VCLCVCLLVGGWVGDWLNARCCCPRFKVLGGADPTPDSDPDIETPFPSSTHPPPHMSADLLIFFLLKKKNLAFLLRSPLHMYTPHTHPTSTLPPSTHIPPPPNTHTQVYAGYDGGSAYSKPSKEDLSKVVGRSME
jgi:hypothetical protein